MFSQINIYVVRYIQCVKYCVLIKKILISHYIYKLSSLKFIFK